jgi:hypothetical protein
MNQNKLECFSLASDFSRSNISGQGPRTMLHLGRLEPNSQSLDQAENACQEQRLQIIFTLLANANMRCPYLELLHQAEKDC